MIFTPGNHICQRAPTSFRISWRQKQVNQSLVAESGMDGSRAWSPVSLHPLPGRQVVFILKTANK